MVVPLDIRQTVVTPPPGTTVLDFDFYVSEDLVGGVPQLAVTLRRDGALTSLTYGSDWTVTGLGRDDGGVVTLAAPSEDGDEYRIAGRMAFHRVSDYARGQALSSAALNADFDRQWMALQEMRRDVDMLALAVGDGPISGTLIDEAISARVATGAQAVDPGNTAALMTPAGTAAHLAANLGELAFMNAADLGIPTGLGELATMDVADLGLGELATMDVADLGLGELATMDVADLGIPTGLGELATMDVADLNLGELATMDVADLGLGELATMSVADLGLGELATMSVSDLNLGELATMDVADLGLGALATKNSVGATDIDVNAVVFSRMQNISTGTILGRRQAGDGNVQQLTAEQARIVLGLGDLATKNQAELGLGELAFLDLDDLPSGGGGEVALTDIEAIDTARLLGRASSGSGAVEALTASTVKSLLGITAADVSGLGQLATMGVSDLNLGALAAKDKAALTDIETIATGRLLGRSSSGTGAVQSLTASTVKSLLGITAADVSGLGALATKNSVGATDIDVNAVVFSRMQNISTGTILGRRQPGDGNVQQLTAEQARIVLGLGELATMSVADILAIIDQQN